ncbi:Hypothetical predicted protein [Xyrichtys novacula]|uniref:Uncharacterized protein n=1 Tax=Xyrichtys novacula TaxID=13765 RepID=A0AAV1FCQ2_XYRNO|nr:Hypothetical predicted protein [Xyrichtys novacula]
MRAAVVGGEESFRFGPVDGHSILPAVVMRMKRSCCLYSFRRVEREICCRISAFRLAVWPQESVKGSLISVALIQDERDDLRSQLKSVPYGGDMKLLGRAERGDVFVQERLRRHGQDCGSPGMLQMM